MLHIQAVPNFFTLRMATGVYAKNTRQASIYDRAKPQIPKLQKQLAHTENNVVYFVT